MKKTKKIGLSLNKRVVSNLTQKRLTGGFSGTQTTYGTCPPTTTQTTQMHNSCAQGCGLTTTDTCTLGCAQ